MAELLGPEKEGRTVALKVEASSHGITAGDARISVRPREDAPVERWIEYLDEEVQALRERLQKIQRKHLQRMVRLSEQLKETRRQLRAADQEAGDLLQRLAIGGCEWELVGLGWFLVGVVAATWGAQVF